jgi:hypothetical protein
MGGGRLQRICGGGVVSIAVVKDSTDRHRLLVDVTIWSRLIPGRAVIIRGARSGPLQIGVSSGKVVEVFGSMYEHGGNEVVCPPRALFSTSRTAIWASNAATTRSSLLIMLACTDLAVWAKSKR